MDKTTSLQVAKIRVRRTHLGPRYDIYTDGTYRATAQTAREIAPILEALGLE